jgi:2-hydroxy-3-oxopropionate reductase
MSADDIGPVAFLGLGRMGRPMAANLAAAGFTVRAWNRSRRSVTSERLTLTTSPAEAVRDSSVVLTMLPNLAEVIAVCDGPDGALAAAAAGTVVVVMGTVSPVGVAAWARELADRRLELVDAPVSGGDVGAQTGELSIMVGGASDAVRRVRPLLAAMGSSVRHLGPVGSGQLAKACNQIVVGATLAALGEAVTLARAGGLDVPALLDVLAGGLAASRALEVKRGRLEARSYPPGGAAAFQHKDLGIALETARALGVTLPVSAVIDQLYGVLAATGHGDDDHSGVVQVIEQLSGRD